MSEIEQKQEFEKKLKENAQILEQLAKTDPKDAEVFDKLQKSDPSLEDLRK